MNDFELRSLSSLCGMESFLTGLLRSMFFVLQTKYVTLCMVLICHVPCRVQVDVAVDMQQRYVGHCNTGTDIKQASFLGEKGPSPLNALFNYSKEY